MTSAVCATCMHAASVSSLSLPPWPVHPAHQWGTAPGSSARGGHARPLGLGSAAPQSCGTTCSCVEGGQVEEQEGRGWCRALYRKHGAGMHDELLPTMGKMILTAGSLGMTPRSTTARPANAVGIQRHSQRVVSIAPHALVLDHHLDCLAVRRWGGWVGGWVGVGGRARAAVCRNACPQGWSSTVAALLGMA